MSSKILVKQGDLIEFEEGDTRVRGIVLGFSIDMEEDSDEYKTMITVVRGKYTNKFEIKNKKTGIKQQSMNVDVPEEVVVMEAKELIDNMDMRVVKEGNCPSDIANFMFER